jgi:hypothetical protein
LIVVPLPAGFTAVWAEVFAVFVFFAVAILFEVGWLSSSSLL